MNAITLRWLFDPTDQVKQRKNQDFGLILIGLDFFPQIQKIQICFLPHFLRDRQWKLVKQAQFFFPNLVN